MRSQKFDRTCHGFLFLQDSSVELYRGCYRVQAIFADSFEKKELSEVSVKFARRCFECAGET